MQFFRKLLFAVFLALSASVSFFSQTAESAESSGKTSNEFKPEGFWENLAKKRIAEEKKDYEKLIRRTEEIFQISEELEKNYEKNARINPTDLAKIELLEKTVKKVREDLGSKEENATDDKNNDKSLTLKTAVVLLKENSEILIASMKKSTRFTISVLAIQSSNNILKALRYVKSQLK